MQSSHRSDYIDDDSNNVRSYSTAKNPVDTDSNSAPSKTPKPTLTKEERGALSEILRANPEFNEIITGLLIGDGYLRIKGHNASLERMLTPRGVRKAPFKGGGAGATFSLTDIYCILNQVEGGNLRETKDAIRSRKYYKSSHVLGMS